MGKTGFGEVGGGGGARTRRGFKRTGSIFSSAYLNELLDIRYFFRHDGLFRVGGKEVVVVGKESVLVLLHLFTFSREFSITI